MSNSMNNNIINKLDLVKGISDDLNLPQATVKQVMDALCDLIKTKLSKNEKGAATTTISIAGFGNFSIKHRKPRTGRNPKTGEPIQIKAVNVVGFKPSKIFKDLINFTN